MRTILAVASVLSSPLYRILAPGFNSSLPWLSQRASRRLASQSCSEPD